MSGRIFIVAAPSGAGKSSLVAALLAQDPRLKLSVSFTTRKPRAGEVDGVAYHFTTVADFLQRRSRGEFLESARVHDNYYGTSRVWIGHMLDQGHDIVLEIDWQGAEQVRAAFPAVHSIFVLPPSLEELERRLRGRGTDSAESIATRLANARVEMGKAPCFDYTVVNDQFDRALVELQRIIAQCRAAKSPPEPAPATSSASS